LIAFGSMQGMAMVMALWAQWTNPYTHTTWNNPTSSLLDTFNYGRTQQHMLEKSFAARQADRPAGPAARPAAPVAHRNLAASDFIPASHGRPTVENYLAAPNLTPEARQQMRAMFAATFDLLGRTRKNNVATALASVMGMATMIVSGRPMSDAAAREMLLGVNDLLAGSPEFATLRPAQKQAMYETLVIIAATLAMSQEAARTNPQMRAQSVSFAQSVLQTLTGSATVR
jgi:hypothetical protein